MIDYVNDYRSEALMGFDGITNLKNNCIKYGDALAAICYSMDIPYSKITEHWPEVNQNERWVGGSVKQQELFLQENCKRDPGHILEIGAGRGEVTVLLTKMGYKVTTVDPGKDFVDLLEYSKQQLYPGETITPHKIINKPLHLADLDYSKYDTIIMVESLEHILEEHFTPEWEKINNNFTGYFVVVNWKTYHPIAVGQYAPANIHCRRTDDALYDSFCVGNKQLIRDGSHIAIEVFKK